LGRVPNDWRVNEGITPSFLLPEDVADIRLERSLGDVRSKCKQRPRAMRVTALMPMRHSSERVPGKNYRLFNGVPLFEHMLRTLLLVPEVEQVVIDTDSALIREICENSYPKVIVLDRDQSLLGGEVPMTEILRNNAERVPSEWYLQTHSTNPLLRSKTISEAIVTLDSSIKANDSLFSVNRLQTRLYDANGSAINHNPAELLRTQDLPPVFEENSNLYLFSKDLIAEGKRIGKRPFLFEMDQIESVDIDEEHDFVIAEQLQKLVKAQ